MDIKKYRGNVVFCSYDIPSPDQWKNNYEIIFRITLDSNFLDETDALEQKQKLILANLKTTLQQEITTGKNAKTNKDLSKEQIAQKKGQISSIERIIKKDLPFYQLMNAKNWQFVHKKTQKMIRDILFDTGNLNFKTLTNNHISVKDKSYKLELYQALLDKGLRVRPTPPKNNDFWIKLSDIQKRHNEYVFKGKQDATFTSKDGMGDKDGHKSFYGMYPKFKGQYVGEFNPHSKKKEEWKKYEADGRLLRLRWSFSSELFTDADQIKNIKFIKRTREKELIEKTSGKKVKVPSNVSEYIGIPQAFVSARSVLNTRLKKKLRFISNKDSSYILPVEKALAPNSFKKDASGNILTRMDISPVTKMAEKVEEVWHDPDMPPVQFTWNPKTEQFEGHIEGTANPPPRMPDSLYADTLEEVFISELMPLFVLLEKFMKDSVGRFKQRYLFGFDKLLKERFDDWISLYAMTPPNYKSYSDLASDLAKDFLNQNPDLFLKILNEVRERHTEFVKKDKKLGVKRVKNWLDIRKKQRYLKTIDKSYHFAETLDDDHIDEYITHFNLLVTIYNRKKGQSNELIKGDKEFIRDFVKYMLRQENWYYTFPTEHLNADLKISEPDELKDRRNNIEKYIFEIEQRIDELMLLPENIDKEVVYKDDLIKDLADVEFGGERKLIEIYKDIHINKGKYSSPTRYKEWIKELVTSVPTDKQIENEQQENLKKTKEDENRLKQSFDDMLRKILFKGTLEQTISELRSVVMPEEFEKELGQESVSIEPTKEEDINPFSQYE